MFNDVYNLRWKHFKVNQDSALEELFTKNNNQTDVTLVSDDKVAFPAHKFVLGASSPVLKDLLVENPHPHPIIYLKEINSLELKSILKLIYLGKTEFFHNRMKKFFETGKELKIKNLSHPLILNDEHEVTEFSDIELENKVDNVVTEDHDQNNGVLSQYDLDDGKFVGEHRCEICQVLFRSKRGLLYHSNNMHKGFRYLLKAFIY